MIENCDNASTVLKAQIIGKGKVIFNGDNLRRMVYGDECLQRICDVK